MQRQSLGQRLVKIHALILGVTCGLLTLFALVAGAYLLRDSQDQELLELADALCQTIENAATQEKGSPIAVAKGLLEGSAVQGYRYEFLDENGTPVAVHGELEGWERNEKRPLHRGECASAPGLIGEIRYCESGCLDNYAVRVGSTDALGRPGEARTAIVLLVAAPLAVGVGVIVLRRIVKRQLAPLLELTEATRDVHPPEFRPLGVHAESKELAELEEAFDHLLSRLRDAMQRERRFAQEASHELRTPVTSIRARLERLASHRDPVERDGTVRECIKQIDALSRLTDSLLLLARGENLPTGDTPVNLCDVARDTVRQQRRSDPERSPEIRVHAPDELLVRGSEELLARALGNLIENARHYAGADALIAIAIEARGNRIAVTVDDNGPGFDPAVRPVAFERFTRGSLERSRSGGAGLGLAVTRAIIQGHGGTISIGENDWGGARVEFAIPEL